MTGPKKASEVLHIRIPLGTYDIIDKMAITTGVGISTQVKILLNEALKQRNLIK